MKGKVYIFPIVSFLLLLIPASIENLDSNIIYFVLLLLIILSGLTSIIGIIQVFRKWRSNNAVISIILLLLNIILVISSSFWFIAFLSISSYQNGSIVDKFINIYRRIIPFHWSMN
jgi:hypothetical protein